MKIALPVRRKQLECIIPRTNKYQKKGAGPKHICSFLSGSEKETCSCNRVRFYSPQLHQVPPITLQYTLHVHPASVTHHNCLNKILHNLHV